MNTTDKLGLKMPEYTDTADIEDLNENAEILDAAVGGLQEGLAFIAVKSGDNWILPSGTNAVNGDYIVVDNVLGHATDTITGGSTVIASGTNWEADNGCLNKLNDLFVVVGTNVYGPAAANELQLANPPTVTGYTPVGLVGWAAGGSINAGDLAEYRYENSSGKIRIKHFNSISSSNYTLVLILYAKNGCVDLRI